MSGLSSYSDLNKHTSQGLTTVYLTRHDMTSQSHEFWQYTRVRTKRYSYTGMTKAAAYACADAKIALYMRTYRYWSYYNGRWRMNLTQDGIYTDLVADIAVVHTGGDLWEVQISVDETAVIYMAHPPEDIGTAFEGYYGVWEYDE